MMVPIPQTAVDLVAEFEGFRSHAYLCPAGVWTIGYGTTEASGVGLHIDAGRSVSEPHARLYLRHTLANFGEKIRPKVLAPLDLNQWAAMLSLAYNIGPKAFARSSVLRLFNAGDTQGAADAFRMWNKAGGKVLKGLKRRREAERALFLTPSVLRVN